MASWTSEPVVEHLPAGVSSYLRCQTSQQSAQGLGPVVLQPEIVLELPDHPLYELPLASGLPAGLLRPRPLGALLWGSGL